MDDVTDGSRAGDVTEGRWISAAFFKFLTFERLNWREDLTVRPWLRPEYCLVFAAQPNKGLCKAKHM